MNNIMMFVEEAWCSGTIRSEIMNTYKRRAQWRRFILRFTGARASIRRADCREQGRKNRTSHRTEM